MPMTKILDYLYGLSSLTISIGRITDTDTNILHIDLHSPELEYSEYPYFGLYINYKYNKYFGSIAVYYPEKLSRQIEGKYTFNNIDQVIKWIDHIIKDIIPKEVKLYMTK